MITDSTGTVVLADVGNHGDHRLAVKLKDIAPTVIQATVAIEDRASTRTPVSTSPASCALPSTTSAPATSSAVEARSRNSSRGSNSSPRTRPTDAKI